MSDSNLISTINSPSTLLQNVAGSRVGCYLGASGGGVRCLTQCIRAVFSMFFSADDIWQHNPIHWPPEKVLRQGGGAHMPLHSQEKLPTLFCRPFTPGMSAVQFCGIVKGYGSKHMGMNYVI